MAIRLKGQTSFRRRCFIIAKYADFLYKVRRDLEKVGWCSPHAWQGVHSLSSANHWGRGLYEQAEEMYLWVLEDNPLDAYALGQ